MRYIYTIVKAYQQFSALKNIIQDKNQVFSSIIDIKLENLQQLDIKVLALDFDGVLNSYGEILPRQDVIEWLKNMEGALGADNIFIVSNKPLLMRIRFFADYFPGVRFIQGVRKKPYIDGLNKIFEMKGIGTGDSMIQKRQVALIDDRLLTGILATCIARCMGIYIQKPYIQFRKRPIVEGFFWMLRWVERRLFE